MKNNLAAKIAELEAQLKELKAEVSKQDGVSASKPEPRKRTPEKGEIFYSLDMYVMDDAGGLAIVKWGWSGDVKDKFHLALNNCHPTAEAAKNSSFATLIRRHLATEKLLDRLHDDGITPMEPDWSDVNQSKSCLVWDKEDGPVECVSRSTLNIGAFFYLTHSDARRVVEMAKNDPELKQVVKNSLGVE